ncbi:MAG: hypothetical protein DWQ07_02290 [Chloroflexi bacterium]|nr:MAG: hypothetical protein DWQ07_02290 [Chloroflexota bacterium]MBL1193672.1 hypothetical protein [Chloroflexota bacterium]NOH10964.1 hypothetical protein [Chloroflexota bacterium]
MVNRLDISTFEYDESLASDRNVFVAIKGFGQLAIVKKIIERKGAKAYGLTSVTDVSQRRYSSGLIAYTNLERNVFDDATLDFSMECTEPYEIDVLDNRLAVTSGPRFRIHDVESKEEQEFTNNWMSYLHTIEFSDDGRRILTAATGLDTILEVDLESGKILWEWNAWDNGIQFVTMTGTYITRDPKEAEELKKAHPDAEVQLIDDPLKLPREGLPTHHSPMNLNGAHYGKNGQVIATGYHRSEVFVIERDGSFKKRDLELSHPHSFRPLEDGYMIASTGHGQFLLLDEEFGPETLVDFSTLPADEDKKAGFGEWLQTVSPLDADNGLFSAVDALRDGVHIIDIQNKKRRFISNPPEWTIQAVINAPITREQFPASKPAEAITTPASTYGSTSQPVTQA